MFKLIYYFILEAESSPKPQNEARNTNDCSYDGGSTKHLGSILSIYRFCTRYIDKLLLRDFLKTNGFQEEVVQPMSVKDSIWRTNEEMPKKFSSLTVFDKYRKKSCKGEGEALWVKSLCWS